MYLAFAPTVEVISDDEGLIRTPLSYASATDDWSPPLDTVAAVKEGIPLHSVTWEEDYKSPEFEL